MASDSTQGESILPTIWIQVLLEQKGEKLKGPTDLKLGNMYTSLKRAGTRNAPIKLIHQPLLYQEVCSNQFQILSHPQGTSHQTAFTECLWNEWPQEAEKLQGKADGTLLMLCEWTSRNNELGGDAYLCHRA